MRCTRIRAYIRGDTILADHFCDPTTLEVMPAISPFD
jgi:hypothetical protein